jgi:hypothetical protein
MMTPRPRPVLPIVMVAVACCALVPPLAAEPPPRCGFATAEAKRPARFPHRIWAACDFESPLPDYAWFAPPETKNIPAYPGNATALSSVDYAEHGFARMTGINPVPGPKMGKVNYLYCRYHLAGGSDAVFQHFSLTREDNNHINVSGLTQGEWSEVTLNFTRDAARNDGSAEAFAEGERMDDFKVFVGKPGEQARWAVFIDDVIFFAEDPDLPPEEEPFPNRVIYLAAFDTGTTPLAEEEIEKDPRRSRYKYWRGDLEVVADESELPAGSYWGVAKAVPRRDGGGGKGKFISLMIDPPKPVGAHTKLRFRYHLTGASAMTVQVFDATDQDNRHVRLDGLKNGEWATAYVDFTKDGRRNDGTDPAKAPFAAGHKVDDLFFFVEPADPGADDFELFIDEVVLFDAGT